MLMCDDMYELDFDVIRIVAVGNIKVQSGQWKCLAARKLLCSG